MSTSKKPGVLNAVFGLLGGNTESRRLRSRSKRICRIEELESRELLAVSTWEFCTIRDYYAELNLSAHMSDYNIIEITEAELSAKALQAALNTAAKTTQDDLIVVRTTLDNSVIDLGNTTLAINIDASLFGSVAIVTLGNEKLYLTSGSASGVVAAANGNVAFGGIVLSSTNNTLNIDNVLRTTSSVQLVTSHFVKTVEKEGTAGNYSTGNTYADASLLTPLSAGTAIGLKNYEIDVQIGGTVYAYLTGLSLSERNAIISDPTEFLNHLNDLEPYDAEKTMSGDSLLCWAASSANMLAYTGWGNVNGFQTEDDIFAYFSDHFTNNGGHQFYANEWFLTGRYYPLEHSLSPSAWSMPTMPGTGGGFYYPSITYSAIAGNFRITSVNTLTNAIDKLKAGCAVGMGTTDHALTLWGTVYDTSKIGTTQYYVSIFLTDSDDNKNSYPNGPDAPNLLRNNTLSWSGSSCSIYLSAYGRNSQLVEVTWLAPFAPPKDFQSTGITDNSVTLEWTARDGATGYLVKWWKADDPTNVLDQSVSGRTTTTITIPTLEPGTTYVFQIYTACGPYVSVQSAVLTKTTVKSDYNIHDWDCVERQGLEDYATWELMGEEYRLTMIEAAGAGLTGTIDLSGCEMLTFVDVANNQLEKLNLSGCTALEELYCDGNALTFSTLLLPPGYSGVADFGTQELLPILGLLTTNSTLDGSREYLDGRTCYTWFYAANDTVVNPALYKERNGMFTFTGVEPDTVIYCLLTNSTDFPGLTLRTTPTTIVLAPSAANPVKPAIITKKTTINSIRWTWVIPSKNQDYNSANYVITCTSHPEILIPSKWIVITGKRAVITIDGLAPGKKYKFTIAAVSASGKTVTVSVSASTKKYTAMKGLRVNKLTISSATLTSSMPAISEQTGGFQIEVSSGKVLIGTLTVTGLNLATDVSFVPAAGYTGKELTLTAFTLNRNASGAVKKFSMTIEGLAASTKHTFSVRATAGALVSSAAKVSGSTKKYSAVPQIMAIAKTDTTITLTWAPSKFSETTHYVITWVNGFDRSVTVDKNTLLVTVVDLSPLTKYEFTIQAVVKKGDDIVLQSLSAKISAATAQSLWI